VVGELFDDARARLPRLRAARRHRRDQRPASVAETGTTSGYRCDAPADGDVLALPQPRDRPPLAIQSTASHMTLYTETFRTSFGLFSIAVTETGALAATAFGDAYSLRSRLGKCHLIDDTSRGRLAHEQVLAYFAGERRDFDLPLAPV